VKILWEGEVRYMAPGTWLARIDGLPGDTRQVQLAAARALLAQQAPGVRAVDHVGADGIIVLRVPTTTTYDQLAYRMRNVRGLEYLEPFFTDGGDQRSFFQTAETPLMDSDNSPPPGPAAPPPIVLPVNGFSGLGSGDTQCGCQPPDTIAASGPDSVLETVNTTLALYNKETGARTDKMEFFQFFAPLGGTLRFSDPTVTYDEIAQKFVVAILDYNEVNTVRLDFAVSNDSDPTLSASDWTFRRYNTNDQVGSSFDFSDYPKVGYNADGYVYSFNMFPNLSFFDHVSLLTVRKSDLTGFLNVVPGGFTNFTFAPALMHGSDPGDPLWFVEDGAQGGANTVTHVVRMGDPFSSTPVFTNTTLPVTGYAAPPRAAQPGGSNTIDTLDARFYFSALRDGQLAAAHTVGAGGVARVRWYQFDVSGAAPTLVQEGEINPGPGVYTFLPSVDIDPTGAIALNYSQTSTTAPGGYWSMYVTGRTPGDPPGTMEDPILAKQGVAYSNEFRAGDYSSVTVDPTDGTFWAANEYADVTPGWSTWVAHFRVAIPAGPSVVAQTPAGNVFGPVSSLRVTFDEEIQPDTFTTDQISNFLDSHGNPVTVTDVEPVAGTGNHTFEISFPAQSALGVYSMVIGPDILDLAGNAMDQDHDGITGEIPGDQYVARFTIQGPKIVASTPTGNANLPGAVASVTVTFNEPMDPSTFTPDKVAGFRGPDGFHNILAVTPVAGSNDTRFQIQFAPLTVAGGYQMLVGPDIRDLFGHAMDQNGNFIEGELPGDLYPALFGVTGPAVVSRAFTPADHPTTLRVTFNEPVDPASFTPDDVSFQGPDGPVDVLAVTPVSGTNNTQFNIAFSQIATAGLYVVGISPAVRDLYGNTLGNEYVTTYTQAGPRVTSTTLTGNLPSTTTTGRFTFSEPMNPSTATPDQFQIDGPDGQVPVLSVTPVSGSNNTQFDITFAPDGLGAYVVSVGPDIYDIYGNPMDAPFTSQFTLALIINGGFETGRFSGWTLSGNTGATFVTTAEPHSGNFAADLGPVGSDGFIAQTFATTPGASYTLDYWLANDGGTPNDFAAYLNGVVVPGSQLLNADGFAYTEYTFTFVATGATTELKFGFRQDPAYYHLDDVSVTPAPGPSGSAADHAARVSASLAAVPAPAAGGGVPVDRALGSSGGGSLLLPEAGDTLAALALHAVPGDRAAPWAGADAFPHPGAAQRPAPGGTEALDGLFTRLGEGTARL
jgi:hypothetical protein